MHALESHTLLGINSAIPSPRRVQPRFTESDIDMCDLTTRVVSCFHFCWGGSHLQNELLTGMQAQCPQGLTANRWCRKLLSRRTHYIIFTHVQVKPNHQRQREKGTESEPAEPLSPDASALNAPGNTHVRDTHTPLLADDSPVG